MEDCFLCTLVVEYFEWNNWATFKIVVDMQVSECVCVLLWGLGMGTGGHEHLDVLESGHYRVCTLPFLERVK